MPLLIFHDVGWPLGRRDAYYAPERIPEEHRQPLARDVGLAPGEPGTVARAGCPSPASPPGRAGPRNGVLTAIEDFLAEPRGAAASRWSRRSSASGSSGTRDAPWADAVAAVLAPWDRNPVLERLEANRIRHMIERYRITSCSTTSRTCASPRDELLRALADSRALRARRADLARCAGAAPGGHPRRRSARRSTSAAAALGAVAGAAGAAAR